MTDNPQWAAQKACDLLNAEHGFAFAVLPDDANSATIRALARLIAKTMPEPADPLVMLAREMVIADGTVRTGNQEDAIRSGRAAVCAAVEHENRLRLALAKRNGRIVFDEVAPVREVGHE